MNRTPSFISFFIAGLVLIAVAITSCSDGIATVDAAASTSKAEKTAERLVDRSTSRWKLVVAAQEDDSKWIDAYEYEMPEVRKRETLAVFLDGKEKFHYDSPTQPRVLLIDGDDAYVQVDCTWLAFMHPVIAKNNPGHQELMEMLEVWHWSEGDWYMEGPPRERHKFFVDHPELATKSDSYLMGK